jgi:hypothetical protein
MERSRDADRRKKETARLQREADRARCVACGKPVTPEDRCQDGLYLHRECGYATMTQPSQR